MTTIYCGPSVGGAHADRLLTPRGRDRTVVIDLRDLEHYAGSPMPTVARDLITVASYVLLADGSVSRGRRNDPLASKWRRSLELSIPVEEPDRWSAAADALKELLDYATDDDWQFEFRRGHFDDQLSLDLLAAPEPRPTTVLMFSGGLDSLACAYDLRKNAERPVLVTHRTTPSGSAMVTALVERMRGLDSDWRFPNPMLHTMRAPKAGDAEEYSQRSRGVLYMSLGTAVALHNGIDRMVIAENGVTSLNLAQSAQSPGAMRSRTTHPRAIALFRTLLKALDVGTTIETPFSMMTKTDVIKRALDLAPEDLVHSATSCSHAIYRSRATPHCGTCSQCVDRRFSGVAAGWDDSLERPLHTIDLFTAELDDGEQVAYAEQYLRFAVETHDATADGLVLRNPEVWDALVGDDVGRDLDAVASLIGRHASQVLDAWRQIQSRLSVDQLAGRLHPRGLLPRLGKLEHLIEPWQKLAEALLGRIEPAMRRAFVHSTPVSEAELQLAFDVAQTAAGADLVREFPTVSFGLVPVGTRPDFSKTLDLFVEIKFVKDTTTRRRVVDEMLADIVKYRAAGANVLFVVWDNCGCIPDEAALVREVVGSHERVFLRIIRR